jgi:hypothetical protein
MLISWTQVRSTLSVIIGFGASIWLVAACSSSGGDKTSGAGGTSASSSTGSVITTGNVTTGTGASITTTSALTSSTGGSTTGTTSSTGTGNTSSSASSGGTTAGQCPANAIFCADFEDGKIPSAAVFYPAYQRTMISTYMNVDGTMGNHGSTHSLRVTPWSQPMMMSPNFSQMLGVMTGKSTFWTRVYLRTGAPSTSTSMVMGHDTFVAGIDDSANGGSLANAGDPNNGEQVRVGEHSCQLEVNRRSNDNEVLSDAVGGVSNYTCAGGVTFAPDTWYCLETFYDGPNSTVRVFVNGSEVTGLHITTWGPYAYDMFKFGFENYSGTPRNIWYDDVAIATQQIGCFP